MSTVCVGGVSGGGVSIMRGFSDLFQRGNLYFRVVLGPPSSPAGPGQRPISNPEGGFPLKGNLTSL